MTIPVSVGLGNRPITLPQVAGHPSATATPTPASSPTPSVYEGLPDFVPSELDPGPAAADGYVRDAR